MSDAASSITGAPWLWAGASGYAYKEWKGPFYPADLADDGMLARCVGIGEREVTRLGAAERVSAALLGKTQDRAAAMALSDDAGRVRLRMTVDPSGNPRIEFLDDQGKVVRVLAEK